MSGTILHLPETRIEDVERTAEGDLRLVFAPARVVKSEGIPLSDSSTLWTQPGVLTLHEVETEDLLNPPVELAGGSVEVGGIRYMDMLPLPLPAHGGVELALDLAGGGRFACSASRAGLEMQGHPKYVRHLDQD